MTQERQKYDLICWRIRWWRFRAYHASIISSLSATGSSGIIRIVCRKRKPLNLYYSLYGFIANSVANDYIKISARSYLKSLGTGGTTEANHRSRIVNDLRDFLLEGWPICWWIIISTKTESLFSWIKNLLNYLYFSYFPYVSECIIKETSIRSNI